MLVRPSIIIIQNEKLLLLRYNYGGHDVYGLPGGNPDPGESMEETLVRELHEELGVEVGVSPMVLAGQVLKPDKSASTLHCIFAGELLKGTPAPDSRHTTALGLAWMDLAQLSEINMYPNVGLYIKELYPPQPSAFCRYIGIINQQWF